jgi:hypothetical protein
MSGFYNAVWARDDEMLDAGLLMLDSKGMFFKIYPASTIQNPVSRSIVGLMGSFARYLGSFYLHCE